ncbi:hypothetical protein NDU88_003266 [Pleurodeles waltl]|uniref:Uncharacterized protein n=1 Tax=Pleurodeles waltl TaxID=8319 RepID=A0AAV7W4H8_PLEWA|nr:hypothetical protein NDU88_003266 [Pleurodeles waltl]
MAREPLLPTIGSVFHYSQILILQSLCDGPAQCDPFTNPTCEYPIPNAEATNQESLLAAEEEPGSCCAGRREGKKLAVGRRASHIGGMRSSSVEREGGDKRKSRGEEESNGGPKTPASQEAQSKSTGHASGEEWQPHVHLGSRLREQGWLGGENGKERHRERGRRGMGKGGNRAGKINKKGGKTDTNIQGKEKGRVNYAAPANSREEK